MKNRISLSFILTLAFVMFSQVASAQFQGQIKMNVYGNSDGDIEVNEVNMYVTANRIFLKGEDKVSFADGMESGGLLIRNDSKDFILLMSDKEALQITKSEIEGLFDMASMVGGGKANAKMDGKDVKPSYRYSNKTRTINGFKSAEMIVEDSSEKKKGSYLSIWLTPNIDINWGMLSEPWKNLPEEVETTVNGMSRETIFNGKNFPTLIEYYDSEKDETIKIMEVTSIKESNVAKAMVQIPAGVNLVGISELMWKMMMNDN
tara:strand:- start:64170 stop:64952 length:783 start_codon:yes stop_codon:yes gene_type:complete